MEENELKVQNIEVNKPQEEVKESSETTNSNREEIARQLEEDAQYDIDGRRKKKKKDTLPWYFYLIAFFASLFIFYTIFFYLFCYAF